ncbi:hypothetical protein [Reyranella sp.]|uniref:hypothetical protein n=1 Tax=Reyranella sp. TaxID=1929291 RepID=UPI003D104FAA
MKHQLGDAPIQQKYREQMNAIAHALDDVLNPELHAPPGTTGAARETGFVLLVYPIGNLANGDARCNYISNGADRKDVVALMKEMIARFEGQPEMAGRV